MSWVCIVLNLEFVVWRTAVLMQLGYLFYVVVLITMCSTKCLSERDARITLVNDTGSNFN